MRGVVYMGAWRPLNPVDSLWMGELREWWLAWHAWEASSSFLWGSANESPTQHLVGYTE